MNLKDRLKNWLLKKLGYKKLNENPNSSRFTYINDAEEVQLDKVKEATIWYIGNSDELLNYYTAQRTYGFADNPIFNRNRANYFWAIASGEGAITRIHSGVPHAIVDTLSNVIGTPQIYTENEELNEIIDKILKENDFTRLLTQEQRPMTMVQGDGAYKIILDSSISDEPILEYYNYEDVDYTYVGNKLTGIEYRDYYEYEDKNYVLIETREVKDGASQISYKLYLLDQNNDIKEVPIETIPSLANKKEAIFKGLKEPLGVVCKYFYNPLVKNRGRSIFEGKIDSFDALDQTLSQGNLTIRESTPVEYYNPDILERDSEGRIMMPKVYNRQFIAKVATPDGDGDMGNPDIITTQPNLNTAQYIEMAKAQLDFILVGTISPATMGFDIAKKDNADAQREKEKVTIMTRENIMDRDEKQLKKLVKLLIYGHYFLNNGGVVDLTELGKLDITVKFNGFANPSREQQLQTYGNAYAQGIVSPEMVVDGIYGDSLSDEEKAREIEYIKSNAEKDNLGLAGIENYGQETIRDNLQEEERSNIRTPEIER